MSLVCPHCGRELVFAGEPPSFCGYCGQRLSAPSPTLGEESPAEATASLAARTALFSPPPREPEAPSFPEVVGGYRLLAPLGKGGMGTVFEAEGPSRQHVAVKLMAPDFEGSPEALERFRQEGKLASTIDHPRCVFVLAADEEQGQPYIVMELMPGATLKDLVTEQGPLSPDHAVRLILDVIEGLEEAHLCGILHRDVKPSNCFLQADGRTKIGDFGLSKSLIRDANLTRTGTFLGTPLFASPEQVRGEALAPTTDVYSVAATLYYLLVGRAPFEGGDAASTLARIVSDPAPPLRDQRPEISPALERVVLRGLERQRERRWQTLGEFRAALLPFVPGKLSFGGMGIRLGAYVLDLLVLVPLNSVGTFLAILTGLMVAGQVAGGLPYLAGLLLGSAPFLLYFAILEGIGGCSLGKWLLGLRVCGREGGEAPGPGRAFLRAFLVYGLYNGPGLVFRLAVGQEALVRNPLLFILSPWFFLVGILLILSTMRARNGFRGPHEWLSGTRVIQLPSAARRKRYPQSQGEEGLTHPAGLPGKIGPYAVHGLLRGSVEEELLLAEDRALGRKVWLWRRPVSRPALADKRRRLARTARLRWLACGQEEGWQWDAFLAPAGCGLREAVAALGPFSWSEARPLLEELTDELALAGEEGTLPDTLAIDQVWVQPNGRTQLVDVSLSRQGAGRESLALLGQTAALLLEGQSRGPGVAPGPIRAPLPLHVSRFLPRLLGGPNPYKEVKELQADLAATRDRPRAVNRLRRLAHLGAVALVVVVLYPGANLPVVNSPRLRYVTLLGRKIREAENTMTALKNESSLALAVNLVNPSPVVRWQGPGLWAHDMALHDRLEEKTAVWRREHEAWRGTLSLLQRRLLDLSEALGSLGKPPTKEPQTRAVAPAGTAKPAVLRQEAEQLLGADVRSEFDVEAITGPVANIINVTIWPALLVLWAFLTRGGLGYPLTGLRLVRADGRKAAHWQCAARALLFWLPVCGLLVAAVGLDYWFWSLGGPQPGGLQGWLPQLSSGAWLLGLLLLAGYAVLALRSPAQSLHDRLVGTCLVPR
jgi:hypothetical protein